jgi:hypothetical protein
MDLAAPRTLITFAHAQFSSLQIIQYEGFANNGVAFNRYA